MKDVIVAGRYRLDDLMGQGSFGLVYDGTDLRSKQKAAIKLIDCANIEELDLDTEPDTLDALAGGTGIPEMYWYGEQSEYYVLVHELLGASLEDLLNYCGRRFSLQTLLLIAIQAISRIEYVHSKGFLHCDIKPSNFLMGLGDKADTLYIIDFGIAEEFSDPQETPCKAPFIGTRTYGSINAHDGKQLSWRDDLESLGYVLVYCFNGSLPWSSVRATDAEEQDRLLKEKKYSLKAGDLCAGLPVEFATYMDYVRGLAFNQRPDYAYLRRIFDQLFQRSELRDNIFDWSERIIKHIPSLPPSTHTPFTANSTQVSPASTVISHHGPLTAFRQDPF